MYGLRVKLYDALKNDVPLTALGFGDGRILTQHDKDTQPTEGAFIVIRVAEAVPSPFKNYPSNQRRVQFWVHDRPSDFEVIDDAIARLKEIMNGLENTQVTGGGWITDVRWEGDSQDFPDDEARTITRYCQWLITGSAAT